jgi:hypothetical protein
MPQQLAKLATAGLSAVAAAAINGDAVTGLVATGSTQATALPLPAANNQVATTASGTGVLLPPVNAGDTFFVLNSGANALLVYAPTGATINAGASLSIPTLKGAYITAFSATLIGAVVGA